MTRHGAAPVTRALRFPIALRCPIAIMVALALPASRPSASVGERADLTVRGKTLTLMIYRPYAPPSKVKGTVIMGSGDVGWVGLAASMASFLSDEGYVVVGVNVRQYLSSFTSRERHVTPSAVAADYGRIAVYLRS